MRKFVLLQGGPANRMHHVFLELQVQGELLYSRDLRRLSLVIRRDSAFPMPVMSVEEAGEEYRSAQLEQRRS